MRVSQNVFDQPVASVAFRVCQFVKQSPALGHLDFVMKVTFFFVAKGFAIRDKKLEVSGVGCVYGGTVNLVDDAVANRKPKPAARMVGGANAFLVGMRPARLDSRSAECRSASGEICCAHYDITKWYATTVQFSDQAAAKLR